MKKFTFSLERALSWRRTQARIEEWKLEQLHGERSALEAQRKALEREYSGALGVWVSAGPVTGKDLETLDQARKAAAAQAVRADLALRDLERKIAAQTGVLITRRRDVRLIEQLREQRAQEWRRSFQKELDQQADEAHLIRVRSGELGYHEMP